MNDTDRKKDDPIELAKGGAIAECASPPCFMHELDPGYGHFGLPQPREIPQGADLSRWRKAERERLIAARLSVSAAERERNGQAIASALDELFDTVSSVTFGVYWPFRGEPDLRGWMERVTGRGGRCALPVVIRRHAPLEFREWHPGCSCTRGVWNIPVPVDTARTKPDIIVAPVVGFDSDGYRLGYGGGFYDRTLAAMTVRTLVIGVGYAQARVPTIHPQPHDVPMDMVVTEDGVVLRRGGDDGGASIGTPG
ncbi:MAG: 5-formyltetrahydrofolate cyclo-ligase [Hyphomicrobiales bacterium]|nr:5-formyltetrahydrofolate cyclo-ligase [Hyphomicrobiales bacterium]